MLPSNVDPRRPDKVQRYTPNPANGNGQGEDLTPDYMNIIGQHATTANAAEAPDKHSAEHVGPAEPNLAMQQPTDDKLQGPSDDHADNAVVTSSNATNVIPTSPQYGVAIISNAINPTDVVSENVTPVTESVVDTLAKQLDENKDLHSTPSRNDRFKVVKIASLEPFKRGRWKCMDYVDEAPPPTSQQNKVTQSSGSIQVSGGVYFQTQSLPQQQIQQMLLQGGFTNGTQFVPTQVIPQGQYFYPQVSSSQTQSLPQQMNSGPNSMPAQFINTGQTYFQPGMLQNMQGYATMPQGYSNIQYVPANLLQNQNSAFVPTSQGVQLSGNFQQSQTYAGQPTSITQSAGTQPIVNGHAFPMQGEHMTANSLPSQTAKSMILNSSNQQPVVSQSQMNQSNVQTQMPQTNSQSQSVPVLINQQYQQGQSYQHVPNQQKNQNSGQLQGTVQNINPISIIPAPSLIQVPQMVTVQTQNLDQNMANNVYTNPQFTMSVNSLTTLENNDHSMETVGESGSSNENTGDTSEDPSKTNPVVNAIDNKIEQAMDLVKSHLMYTVREEVEVLKEKIAELMEKIQQLETENNFLKSQLPKNLATNVTSVPSTANAPVVSANVSTTVNAAPTNVPSVSQPAINSIVPNSAEIPPKQ